jgi:hypothetical protein
VGNVAWSAASVTISVRLITAPHVHVIQTRSPSTPPSRLKENLVLCLECYAGKPGAPFGVKLKDQVLVTAEEARLIYTYPYNAKLLD